jgi:hypothetical protein
MKFSIFSVDFCVIATLQTYTIFRYRLAQKKWNYFLVYQGKNTNIAVAMASIFDAEKAKKKTFIGLICV